MATGVGGAAAWAVRGVGVSSVLEGARGCLRTSTALLEDGVSSGGGGGGGEEYVYNNNNNYRYILY